MQVESYCSDDLNLYPTQPKKTVLKKQISIQQLIDIDKED